MGEKKTYKKAMLYGIEDIRFVELPIPTPGPGEVVVKNKVSTTCGTDVKIFKRGYPLLKPPHVYGHEFSGVVESVGEGVTKFKPGDRIAVHNSAPCGACYWCKHDQPSLCDDQLFNRGSYAEYMLIPERLVRVNMFHIPDSLSHKAASLMEPLSCAVYGIENTPIALGDTVVVNGAGPIGLMFVKLAVLRGAKVIVTDMRDNRLALATKLGAWKTVNLTGIDDSVTAVRELTDDQRGADVVIEATGLVAVWKTSIDMVRRGGFVLEFGGTKSGSILEADSTRIHYSQITIKGVYHTTPRSVQTSLELIKRGVITPEDFVQNEYSLDELEQAIREHASGAVIKNCIVYND